MHLLLLLRLAHGREGLMVRRVAADLDAAPAHVAQLVPREVVRQADVVRHDEDDRTHAARLEQGQHLRVVVLVAVIEREDDRLFRQLLLPLLRTQVVEQGDGRIPLALQVIELRGKVLRRHVVEMAVLILHGVDHVVFEDGDAVWRCEHDGEDTESKKSRCRQGQRQKSEDDPPPVRVPLGKRIVQ